MTSIKMLREHLNSDWEEAWPEDVKYAVRELLAAIERNRPTGNDGKHGYRHTETCGCEDKVHCNRPVGAKPYWMGVDQYDQCYCILLTHHSGDCKCKHLLEDY